MMGRNVSVDKVLKATKGGRGKAGCDTDKEIGADARTS